MLQKILLYALDGLRVNYTVPNGGRHYINLYFENHQIGRIETTNTLEFLAVVDLMRNEGPHIYWRDSPEILHVGAEPVADGED